MEKSRSLFQQVIGHTMLFVAFLLFATDILAEDVATTDVTTQVNKTAGVNISTSPFPASSKMAAEISMTSLPDATTPGTLSRSLSTSGQPSLSLNAAPPVSKQELQSATAVNTAVPEDTSSPMPSKVTVSIKAKHPRTEATEVQESITAPVQKEVPSKMAVTPHFDNETVSSPTKDLGTRSQGSFSEQTSSAIASLETTKSTKPKEDRKEPMPPSQAVPELTQSPETGSHYMSSPSSTSVTSINSSAIFDSLDKGNSEKKHSVIILAVVFTILLLVGFLAFLCLRRRRHSGSTSFNSPEWAGQATLPDDTGLDKDVEQQAGSGGEGETRRGTLVTFFGKRQSRVPSIAMEDVNGKGGKEETEQLLCGEAETGSPSEAIGDANGKVPEPLKESSQGSSASNKLGESSS
ncbi:leukosialin [Ahaetulla prasina]|uniref:leukosialin n=1 Tax=Ahaetulla prasina TaxID=499056 RepID=UPI0026481B07|nr:leukosialin [Ahaetulla prasina]XP_058036545.1 leukosialin [Ahaetulla prasina]XP_058036546.1 leukosialin [Ahaetulla prasina]